MSSYVFDIETDGLLDATTRLHCLVLRDTESGEVISCTDDSPSYTALSVGLELLENADLIAGHHVLSFDLPALKKLYPSFCPKGTIRDTLVISRLIYPDMKERDFARNRSASERHVPKELIGRHSLKAWGYRLSELKGAYGETTDWQHWTQEMQDYCEQDTLVTLCLWNRFRQMNYSEKAISLEHRFQQIIFQQEQNGFPFKYEEAEKLCAELCAEREALRQELQNLWPPQDKGEWFTPKVNNAKRGYVKGVPVWKSKITPFNPASRDEIAERLKETYGWEPTEKTDTGKPKIDEEVLSALPYPEAKQLSRFFLIQKRIGQIGEGKQAWLKCAVKEPDGIYRIHGRVTTNGAVTGRCTHHDPNIAQVPAVGVPWGHECRSLFYAPEGWSLLGCDASGLELRCLAHFMAKYDGGEYAQIILHGDIHWLNTQLLGLVPKGTERDKHNPEHDYFRNKVAKRFVYATLYGAGGLKIGSIHPPTEKEAAQYLKTKKAQSLRRRLKERGEQADDETIALTLRGNELKERFMKNLPALESLITAVQAKVQKRGTLYGIDRRILPVRSQHSALNTLLQSAGALAVKKATGIFWDKLYAEKLGDKVKQVAHIHDEFQVLVKEGLEKQVGELAVQSFRDAGEYFSFRCPLDGEYKAGKNWAETH